MPHDIPVLHALEAIATKLELILTLQQDHKYRDDLISDYISEIYANGISNLNPSMANITQIQEAIDMVIDTLEHLDENEEAPLEG